MPRLAIAHDSSALERERTALRRAYKRFFIAVRRPSEVASIMRRARAGDLTGAVATIVDLLRQYYVPERRRGFERVARSEIDKVRSHHLAKVAHVLIAYAVVLLPDDSVDKAFNPNQARDSHGRWSSTGASNEARIKELRTRIDAGDISALAEAAKVPGFTYQAPPKSAEELARDRAIQEDPTILATPAGQEALGTAFHGTARSALKSILANGLIPQGGTGADKELLAGGYEHEVIFTQRLNKGRVFYTTSKERAIDYALGTAQEHKSTPIVLKLEIPSSAVGMVEHDPLEDQGVFRFRGVINPEWIKGYYVSKKWLTDWSPEGGYVAGRYYEVRKAYNPDQSRDERGRWSSGGAVQGYHGTARRYLARIRAEGLKPQGGAGAVVWLETKLNRGETAQGLMTRLVDTDAGKVFFAMHPSLAWEYADAVSGHIKSRPVVLELRIPRSEFKAKAEPDSEDPEADRAFSPAWRFKGRVKPEWIVGTVKRPKKTILDRILERAKAKVVKADTVTLYMALFPDQDIIAKAGFSGLSFDAGDEDAAQLMDDSELKFLKDFSDGQRDTIRSALSRSLRRGDSPTVAARSFRDSIGLTDNQAAAVNNYRSLLQQGSSEALGRTLRDRRFDPKVTNAISRGDILDDSQIDRMASRYSDRIQAFRADTIAITESHRVLSEGRYYAWQQMADQLGVDPSDIVRTWNTTQDGRQRDTHDEMDGQQVALDEPYVSPSGAELMYPGDPSAPASETIRCRCVETYDIDTDAVDDTSDDDTSDADAA